MILPGLVRLMNRLQALLHGKQIAFLVAHLVLEARATLAQHH
jgi:hypothetical protein